uniref:Uncharacterized protein n=1 Tax=Sphaerodactylus townsendi TaxID=933632 RepID=A0ACB8EJM5_9SAUR
MSHDHWMMMTGGDCGIESSPGVKEEPKNATALSILVLIDSNSQNGEAQIEEMMQTNLACKNELKTRNYAYVDIWNGNGTPTDKMSRSSRGMTR